MVGFFKAEHCWINLNHVAVIESWTRPNGEPHNLAILTTGDSVKLNPGEMFVIAEWIRTERAPRTHLGPETSANDATLGSRTEPVGEF